MIFIGSNIGLCLVRVVDLVLSISLNFYDTKTCVKTTSFKTVHFTLCSY